MSYKFSTKSEERLATCDIRLQTVMALVLDVMDISIVCGYRNYQAQDKAFELGYSKLKWPHSKHNESPSKAVDVIPYPTKWDSKEHFYMLNGAVQAIASRLGYTIRWGGDWNRNNIFTDQSFNDLAHFELVD